MLRLNYSGVTGAIKIVHLIIQSVLSIYVLVYEFIDWFDFETNNFRTKIEMWHKWHVLSNDILQVWTINII